MISLPVPNCTAARAFAVAETFRAGLPIATLNALDEAIHLARTHPLMDVLDAFCDGVNAVEQLPADQRIDAITKLHGEVVFAAWPGGSPVNAVLSHDGNVTTVQFRRHEKSDADYIRDRITALLEPWDVSATRIRAAIRAALNLRRDNAQLGNDEIVHRIVLRNKPTGGDRA